MSTTTQSTNPYASPKSLSRRANARKASKSNAQPLFTPGQIGIATFLASAMAGTTLMAMNYFRLNKVIPGILSLILGVGIVVATGAAGMAVAELGMLLGFGQMAITYAIAKGVFAREYKANKANETEIGSGWTVAIVTLVWVVIVTFIILSTVQF